jgi:hypothetical protein
MRTLETLDVEEVAAAIEADAGQALPGLRESLAEAKAGQAWRVHAPERQHAHQPPPGFASAGELWRDRRAR